MDGKTILKYLTIATVVGGVASYFVIRKFNSINIASNIFGRYNV